MLIFQHRVLHVTRKKRPNYLVNPNKSRTFALTNPTTLLVARPADQGGTFFYMEYTKQPITLAEQIDDEMDQLWESGQFDEKRMQDLRDSHFRTPYNK